MPKKKGNLNIDDGPVHRPREKRPHLAQEYFELYGYSDRVPEFLRRLKPSVRHRAVGAKRGALPASWMKQHIDRGGRHGPSVPDPSTVT